MRRESRPLALALLLAAACRPDAPAPPPAVASKELPPADAVLADMRRVADTVLARPLARLPPDWVHAPLYMGMTAAWRATGDRRYLDAMLDWAEGNDWRLGPAPRMADDHAVGQLYLDLHEAVPGAADLGPLKARFDTIAEQPMLGSVAGWHYSVNWSWADALFMAPPVFSGLTAATGDRRYLEAMDTMWWETVDLLYDPEDRLFFRDTAWVRPEGRGRSAVGGRKVFWGRGNGWVLSGTARVLDAMPADFPSRPRYVALFRAMAERLAGLQGSDGFWRTDLIRHDAFPGPETSATALVTHGLAWGVAEGVLEEDRFLPVVARAYNGLRAVIDEEGVIRWVQPGASAPGPVPPEGAEAYGTGAFLMAAEQVARLAPGGGSEVTSGVSSGVSARPRAGPPATGASDSAPGDPF